MATRGKFLAAPQSRLPGRLLVYALGSLRLLIRWGAHSWLRRARRQRPQQPGRILILAQLFLGDTLMLTPLLAKLRMNHPQAEIVLTMPSAYLPLYAGRPYGVEALALNERDVASYWRLMRSGPFDWCLIPAENRLSWLGVAAGSRWLCAFAGEPGRWKNFPIDELRPFAPAAKAWGELVCELADGDEPATYRVTDWPAPAYRPFELPPAPYVVLHIGVSSLLKKWPAQRWRELAGWLEQQGLNVVFACGKGETAWLDEIAPASSAICFAGTLDLPQYWALLKGARLLVCPDTGIAHLAHLIGTPSVVLYGPGNPAIFGRGAFWQQHRESAVFAPNFFCRNENRIFRRRLSWGEFCARPKTECARPLCMEALTLANVIQACQHTLN